MNFFVETGDSFRLVQINDYKPPTCGVGHGGVCCMSSWDLGRNIHVCFTIYLRGSEEHLLSYAIAEIWGGTLGLLDPAKLSNRVSRKSLLPNECAPFKLGATDADTTVTESPQNQGVCSFDRQVRADRYNRSK